MISSARSSLGHTICQAVPGQNALVARHLDEGHRLGLAGLEPGRRPRRDVEAHPDGGPPIEDERPVGLDEGVVRPDLDRPVAGVGYRQLDQVAAGIDGDGPQRIAGQSRAGHGGVGGLLLGAQRGEQRRRIGGQGQERPGQRQAEIALLGGDGGVDRQQLGAIGKGGLDLHVLHHLIDSWLDVTSAQELLAQCHEIGDRFVPISDALHHLHGDEGDGLGLVEPDAPGQTVLGQTASIVQE